jgi:pimeloyl-ACP methyl ester carboxylesterase
MTDQLDRGNGAKLHYEYDAPSGERPTFVFVNAITGSTAQWQGVIGPALRAEGFGTLAYNMRGQENSPSLVEEPLEEAVHVEDLGALLDHVAPPRPILTGLSIGGLFATKAFLAGAPAAGFVYLNTLRAPGLALDWLNEAIFRAAGLGGPALVMDMFLPLLVGPAHLARMRGNCLGAAPYQPPGPEDGVVRLLSGGREANWNVDWSRVVVPVLNVTGLQDRVFYNGADVARLAALMPDLEHVALPEIGHLIPAEAPETLARLLIGFGTRILANRMTLS